MWERIQFFMKHDPSAEISQTSSFFYFDVQVHFEFTYLKSGCKVVPPGPQHLSSRGAWLILITVFVLSQNSRANILSSPVRPYERLISNFHSHLFSSFYPFVSLDAVMCKTGDHHTFLPCVTDGGDGQDSHDYDLQAFVLIRRLGTTTAGVMSANCKQTE